MRLGKDFHWSIGRRPFCLPRGILPIIASLVSLNVHVSLRALDLDLRGAKQSKERKKLITPALQKRLWPFLGGIAPEDLLQALMIGGTEDPMILYP